MPVNSAGFITARDHFVVDFDKAPLLARIAEFSNPKISDSEIRFRIREIADDAIRTAVRRGILSNEAGNLALATRSIEDYERSQLKDQFLASLGGSRWTDRDEAVRQLARWLGFRRTGPAIDEVARSLINGLLREARL